MKGRECFCAYLFEMVNKLASWTCHRVLYHSQSYKGYFIFIKRRDKTNFFWWNVIFLTLGRTRFRILAKKPCIKGSLKCTMYVMFYIWLSYFVLFFVITTFLKQYIHEQLDGFACPSCFSKCIQMWKTTELFQCYIIEHMARKASSQSK